MYILNIKYLIQIPYYFESYESSRDCYKQKV